MTDAVHWPILQVDKLPSTCHNFTAHSAMSM